MVDRLHRADRISADEAEILARPMSSSYVASERLSGAPIPGWAKFAGELVLLMLGSGVATNAWRNHRRKQRGEPVGKDKGGSNGNTH